MKHGTEYAKRVKRLYQDLLKKYGKPDPIEPVDPIEQMLIGILWIDTSLTKAQAAYRKLIGEMVDLNELRVTPPMEIAEQIDGSVPMPGDKARRIVEALNAVRRRQDALDLSFLKQRGRREAREYLESLEGLTPSVAAQVVLFSLQGHAIPVDNLTLYVLRKKELVAPEADISTVQGFLERHVSAADAATFVQLLDRFVAASGSRVPVEQLPDLLNPPPPAEPAPPAEPVAAGARGDDKGTAGKASKGTTRKSASRPAGKKVTASNRAKASPRAASSKAGNRTRSSPAPRRKKK